MTKKIYNQPEVQVATISLESMILVGSPVSGGGKINKGVATDDQW